MENLTWSVAAPAVGAAFLASIVEVVEAFTIILAVGTLRGWRPAIAGTLAGLVVLALIVIILGPLLDQVPLDALQLVIGVLLLLFGLGWLRKAILRSAGVIALHDEITAFANERMTLEDAARRHATSANWLGGITAFKAMLLEGLEVIFIVIAVGSGRGLIAPAAIGAGIACLIVLAVGAVIHKPLSRVPENTLKFGVAIMLSSFGVFWTGEGLGIKWIGQDLMLFVFAAIFLATGIVMSQALRVKVKEQIQ
ncbi:TMEM165/GDT1 family protein (plasmid) [Rhizobium lusitanum]|uniref:COG4280 domain-containing protein n=1 Tax=Rhizobium lusitanum TaxID=293958 RepID=UPI00160AE0D6|nr:TMEM165/GDT1 family protein [Rhizobium lusitanum]QND44312.1 TMEM165/GDT1 family protein [Rhizobium lusitanum]